MNLRQPMWAVAIVSIICARMSTGEEVTRTSRNEAVELTVTSTRQADRYGPVSALPGRQLLIVSTDWRNLVPTAVVDGKALPTPYVVPSLDQQLFVVVNGGQLASFAAAAQGRPGVLPSAPFTVADPQSPTRGNLIFDVPANAADLLLVFLDERYGVLSVRLTGEDKPLATIGRPQKNELIEVLMVGQRVIDDKSIPADSEKLAIDLRFKSIYQPDRKAKCGKVARLGDWQKKYVQLLVDGTYAAAPVAGPYDTQAAILPEVSTGGEFIFIVPRQRVGLDLAMYFGELPLPNGQRARPQPIRFHLDGKSAPPLRPAIVSTKDAIFDVAIVGNKAVDEVAGAKPGADNQFLVADVVVKNIGRQPDFFQPMEQLKHVNDAGVASVAAKVTLSGSHAPQEAMFIPAGETRTFQMIYEMSAAQSKPRIAYAAVTEGAGKTLELPPFLNKPVVKIVVPNTPAHVEPAATATVPATMPAAVVKADGKVIESATTVIVPANSPTTVVRVNGKVVVEPVAARQNRKPRGLAGVGLTPEQVNTAIDKGGEALWKVIRDEDLQHGNKFGQAPSHVLAALAMVHAGAHKKIPEFDATLHEYLNNVQPRTLGTYQAGLVVMLIEAYGDSQYAPKLQEATRYLLEGQGPKGTWNYTPRVPDSAFPKPAVETTGVIRVVGGMPPDRADEVWTRSSAPRDSDDGDNSVTQYALLGLNSASRVGIKVPPQIWQFTLVATRARQSETGGWGYNDQTRPYGSMTAAGICAIALCRHELGEKEFYNDGTIEKGLSWLATHFSVSSHPESMQWLYYYLYSLERVGRILDTEFIGPHEWYPQGASFLLSKQTLSGLWVGEAQEHDPRLATSFALLFLTRATPSLDLKPNRGGPGTLRTVALAPFQNFYIILDASGSMLDEMDGKLKFDIARESVRSLVNDLPSNVNVALRVYGHRKRAIEAKSDEDTELKISMTALDKKKFGAVLDSLRPRGKTPLALSLEAAVKDLGHVDPTKPVTLLLLTDGGEDTTRPRRDPLKAADLLGSVKGIRFHVVGFDINQPDWTEQLLGIAQRGGGQYWPAAKAADLERGVRAAVFGVPEDFTVLDASGAQVALGVFGEPATLKEGKYQFRTVYAGSTFERDFWINTGSATRVTFDASQAPLGRTTAVTPPSATRPVAHRVEPVTEVVKRFCTNCGAAIKSGTKFCENCGAKAQP